MNFDTCNGVIHVVKRGDTLYKLSRIYKVKLSDIISANPYINVYNMQPGDEVCIPVIMEEDFLIYTVQDGDTFEDVLKNTGVSPDDLFKFNPDLQDGPCRGHGDKVCGLSEVDGCTWLYDICPGCRFIAGSYFAVIRQVRKT